MPFRQLGRANLSSIWTNCQRSSFIALTCVLSACATENMSDVGQPSTDTGAMLFNAADALQDNWRHLPIRGKTDYRLAAGDGGVVIRAQGKNSASGLIRSVDVDSHNCPMIEWRWRVDQFQPSADLEDKKREDVAASIFLLFGDPGFMSNPEPVPTLRYVWTNKKHPKDVVIDNPYLPGIVRSIVIRSGESGTWFTETRDVRKDYERAFGSLPKDTIHAIAIFTDNDQTKEPTIAYYCWARVHCAPPK